MQHYSCSEYCGSHAGNCHRAAPVAHLVGCACAIGEMQHRMSVDDKGSGLLKDK